MLVEQPSDARGPRPRARGSRRSAGGTPRHSGSQRLRADKGLFAYELGVIHAALGEPDQAFGWLTRAVQERSGWIAYLRVDPRLDALHADSRFDSLVGEATTRAKSDQYRS